MWKIGGKVGSKAKAEARSTVLAVHDFAISNGLPRIDRPITIFLYHNLDALASEFEATTGRRFEDWFSPSFKEGKRGILSSKDFIAVNTSASRFQGFSSREGKRVLATEMFDVYRRVLTNIWQRTPRNVVSPEGPKWLSEGYAEYFTYPAIGPRGTESCDLTRSSNIVPISWGPADASLSDMETDEGFWSLQSSHQYGILAAELLAEQAGLESLIAYYASLRTGIAWEQAFETAFGMKADEYYQLFEQHRAAGFPEPGTPKPVDGTAPTPGPFSDLLGDPSLPSYIKWDIAESVDQSEVEQAVLGVRLAYELGQSLGIPDPTGQIILFIDNDAERLACFYSKVTGWSLDDSRRHWVKDRAGAEAGRGWIAALASPPGKQYWKRPTEPGGVGGLTGPVAHEIIHASYQNGVLGLLKDPAGFDGYGSVSTPRWLSEGMAVLLTELATYERRGISYSQVREREESRAVAIDLPLREAELWRDEMAREVADDEWDEILFCIYKCGFVAAEILASLVGPGKLSDYYMLLEPWMVPRGVPKVEWQGWRLAFEEAFGMTVDEFYELFEEHRAAGFPEMEIPKVLNR